MTSESAAGEPLEPMSSAVGRSVTPMIDERRQDRMLGIDCWYPAVGGDHPKSVYEVIPGVGFTSSALADAPAAPGAHRLLIWSHGRSGTRTVRSDAL